MHMLSVCKQLKATLIYTPHGLYFRGFMGLQHVFLFAAPIRDNQNRSSKPHIFFCTGFRRSKGALDPQWVGVGRCRNTNLCSDNLCSGHAQCMVRPSTKPIMPCLCISSLSISLGWVIWLDIFSPYLVGFLPQYKDIQIRPIGVSNLPVVCQCVCVVVENF